MGVDLRTMPSTQGERYWSSPSDYKEVWCGNGLDSCLKHLIMNAAQHSNDFHALLPIYRQVAGKLGFTLAGQLCMNATGPVNFVLSSNIFHLHRDNA